MCALMEHLEVKREAFAPKIETATIASRMQCDRLQRACATGVRSVN